MGWYGGGRWAAGSWTGMGPGMFVFWSPVIVAAVAFAASEQPAPQRGGYGAPSSGWLRLGRAADLG